MQTNKSFIPPPVVIDDDDRNCIVERTDGFYWQSSEDGREYGPFASVHAAIADMEYGDSAIETGESLEEAEDEIGIAGWIDPDTGEPAEESRAHIEDH